MSSQEKDKIRPKGAMSAYAYFVQVIREEHKRKHPGEQVVFSEFSKKCAEKWKLMTPKEKKRFEEMANSDKDRYNAEIGNCQQSGEGGRKRKKRRRIKEPGQPKRAWSAFFFFCDEFRPKVREVHPDWRVGNIAKELGHLWEACSDKSKYEKQSENDKQRYEEQMSRYRAGDYVPPIKRTHDDSNGAAMLAGNSSPEEPVIVANDAIISYDEDIEDDSDEEKDCENGGVHNVEDDNQVEVSNKIDKELLINQAKCENGNNLQYTVSDQTININSVGESSSG